MADLIVSGLAALAFVLVSFLLVLFGDGDGLDAELLYELQRTLTGRVI